MVCRKALEKELKTIKKFSSYKGESVYLFDGRLWLHTKHTQYKSAKIEGLPDWFSFVLNPGDLLSAISKMKKKEILITLCVEKVELRVEGEFAVNIRVSEQENDYLNEWSVSEEEKGTAVDDEANDVFAWVSKAMSYDDVRAHMCGVGISPGSFAATDGRRLYYSEELTVLKGCDVANTLDSMFFIPNHIVDGIVNNKLKMQYIGTWNDKNALQWLVIRLENQSVILINANEQMPRFSRVIPEYTDNIITGINADILEGLDSVKRALSMGKGMRVALDINAFRKQLLLSYPDPLMNGELQTVMQLSISMETVVGMGDIECIIFANIEYIIDSLSGVLVIPGNYVMGIHDTIDVEIRLASEAPGDIPTRAITIRNGKKRSVIMPMRNME